MQTDDSRKSICIALCYDLITNDDFGHVRDGFVNVDVYNTTV